MKKFLSLLALSCLGMGAMAEDWTVSLPANRVISVSGTAANNFEPATSADDNAHWYVLQQSRGALTPVQVPVSGNITRTSGAVGTVIANNETYLTDATAYLVRLVPGDHDGAYKIQSATGKYFGTGNAAKSNVDNSTLLQGYEYSKGDNFLVYNIAGQDQHIGFSYTNNGTSFVKILDNNGNGGTVSYWGDGKVNSVNGNNDWRVFKVTISPEEYYDVTYVLNNAYDEECQIVKKATQSGTMAYCPAIDYFEVDQITDADFVSSEKTTFHVTGTWSMPFEENKYYTIKPNNSSNNFVAHGTDYAICNNTITTNVGNDVWKFKHVANTLNLYTLQNVNYGYATVTSSTNQTVLTYQDAPSAWTSGTGKSSYFRITKNDTGFNLQHPGDANANAGNHVGGRLGFWNHGSSSSAPGSRIVVTEFTDEMVLGRVDEAKNSVTYLRDIIGESAATTAISALNALTGTVGEKLNGIYGALDAYYEAANGKKFSYENRMYNTTRYLKAADEIAALQTSATSALTAKNVFEFEHVAGNNFKVKVPYYNTYLNNTSTSTTASIYNLLVHGTNFVGLQFDETTNAIHHQQAGNVPVSYGSTTDASKWYLALVTDEQWAELNSVGDFEVLQQGINKANYYTNDRRIGSELNQYTWTVNGENKNAVWASTLANYQAIVNEATASKADVETYKAEVSAMIAALVINQPKAGSFVRVRSVKRGMGYINAEASSVHTNALKVGSKGTSSIYYYDGTHLLAYNCGQYLVKNSDGSGFLALGAVGNDGCTIEFKKTNAQIGTYAVVFAGNRYLYAEDNAANVDAGGSDLNSGYAFWLEEVETLPLNMVQDSNDGAYYASLNSPVAVTLPAGLKAYSAALQGETLTLTKVVEDGVLAANTPVILYAESAVTSLAISNEAGTGADGNELRGTTAAITAEDGMYVLNTKDHANIGFYKTTSKVNGFKAYYKNNAGSAKLALRFDEVLTAIDAVENANNSAEIYDLQGRRLVKAQQGMNIINGRKVLVK